MHCKKHHYVYNFLYTLLKEVVSMDGAYISAFNMLQNMSRNDIEV